jgi:uncharacterized membrane protein
VENKITDKMMICKILMTLLIGLDYQQSETIHILGETIMLTLSYKLRFTYRHEYCNRGSDKALESLSLAGKTILECSFY